MDFSKYYDLLNGKFSIFKIEAASMDASSRLYLRIFLKNNKTLVLQDNGNDNILYDTQIKSYEFLKKHHIHIPQIIEKLPLENIIIFQDLGDMSLERYSKEHDLLQLSSKIIRSIEGFEQLPLDGYSSIYEPMDEKKYLWGFDFFNEYYIEKFKGNHFKDLCSVRESFEILSKEIAAAKRSLVHRDLHSRNIFIFRDELFIIDYQDLRLGNLYYDRASFLYDLYTDFSKLYPLILPDNKEDTELVHKMAFQRLIKILGNFAYLELEKNKPFYIKNYESVILKKLEGLKSVFYHTFKDIYEIIYEK